MKIQETRQRNEGFGAPCHQVRVTEVPDGDVPAGAKRVDDATAASDWKDIVVPGRLLDATLLPDAFK